MSARLKKGLLVLCAFAWWVAACQPAPTAVPAYASQSGTPTPPPATATALPPTVTPSATPLPTAVPIVEARFTPIPPQPKCTEKTGHVITVTVPSDTLNYNIDTRVYLPPCYEFNTDAHYPTLYLIHGLNFTQDQWERLGAPTVADTLTVAGEIAPLIIVMPRDRLDERLDPAFTNDLVPYIDKHFRTIDDRRFRAIGGLSRGGGWALHIGLHYPSVFGRIGAHSPAVFYGDENKLIDWTHHLPKDQIPAIYVDMGEGDSMLRSAYWLDQIFSWFQLKYTFIIQPGAHIEKYWRQNTPDYLRFYAADWRTMPLPTPAFESPDEISP